jgi:hypothetical protein
MICASSFRIFMRDYTYRSCQIILLLHFIYCTTSGWILKQEGVYVMSRSSNHMLSTYSLRKLACK